MGGLCPPPVSEGTFQLKFRSTCVAFPVWWPKVQPSTTWNHHTLRPGTFSLRALRCTAPRPTLAWHSPRPWRLGSSGRCPCLPRGLSLAHQFAPAALQLQRSLAALSRAFQLLVVLWRLDFRPKRLRMDFWWPKPTDACSSHGRLSCFGGSSLDLAEPEPVGNTSTSSGGRADK